ncbi:MAG TPA: hypothetical protein VFW45_07295, partial [Candidatus Polarisedimenticolia bacterium]|nr:hypothetical protein [Candidatus Polarisedimenticolia bacterium]
VSIDAFPDKKFKAEVVKVGNSAVTGSAANPTEQTTNFRVTVALREPVPGIKPALSCSATITTATRDAVLAVPIQAMTIRTQPAPGEGKDEKGNPKEKGGAQAAQKTEEKPPQEILDDETDESRKEREKEGVFLVRDGVAHFTPVKTGIGGERFFEVLEGLKPGDEVVTGSYQAIRDLKDGDSVKVDNTTKTKPGDQAATPS